MIGHPWKSGKRESSWRRARDCSSPRKWSAEDTYGPQMPELDRKWFELCQSIRCCFGTWSKIWRFDIVDMLLKCSTQILAHIGIHFVQILFLRWAARPTGHIFGCNTSWFSFCMTLADRHLGIASYCQSSCKISWSQRDLLLGQTHQYLQVHLGQKPHMLASQHWNRVCKLHEHLWFCLFTFALYTQCRTAFASI